PGVEQSQRRARRRAGGVGPDPGPDASRVADTDRGGGAARRERRRQRAMRRRRYVVAPAVLAVLVLLAVLGAQLRSESPHRQSARPIPAAPTVARDVPTVLLAHKTPAGKVDLAVVVGVALDGRDASILLVPTLT